MNRDQMLSRVRERSQSNEPWDVIVIGGGATGAGVAVDAASRGFSVLLLEREDFAKATSSRSTKLVHGGVRYLEQGNISLVMEALKERGILRRNAPHLVHDVQFVVPNYSWWEAPFYGIGMKVYDLLAGKYGFGKSGILSREETLERIPTLRQDGLRGGVVYHDGQFDDARLLTQLIETAADHGAVVLNYAPVIELHKDSDGFLDGVVAQDTETGERLVLGARVVVNATGIFTDEVRRMADKKASTMVAPSQGIHLVLDRSFLRGNTAVMVPHTSDGRVLFAIPWHEHTVLGTTDTPIDSPSYEPLPFEKEIEFVLETAGEYLSHKPTRDDVLSVYVGIRPLVKAAGADGTKTSSLSRDHTIHIDQSGLLTIVGGKWTTYRHMAEDAVNHAITLGKLADSKCVTEELRIHGYVEHTELIEPLFVYGSDAVKIQALAEESPELARKLHPDLPYIAAEVIWAVRQEMARTLDDVLARRTRALFLNAHAAVAMVPTVASLMANELGKDQAWIESQTREFLALAEQYMLKRIRMEEPETVETHQAS
jgi:glycerol-3-phosphate dehydrogenase